jgi:transcriptional regulator with XRE-family HTH domain
MGRSSRKRPLLLAEKLLNIRTTLDLSQNELIARIGFQDELQRETISNFERGVREPSLLVLSAYANLAGICLDVLANDELDLPENLPSKPKHKY